MYSFTVNDTALALGPLKFQTHSFRKNKKGYHNVCHKIREKIHYDYNTEAVKIVALSSGKIDKYEFLTSEDILSFNQNQAMEQLKFTASPLGKASNKQTIKD